MAIRRFSIAEPGVKSNKFWDQDTQQGAMVPINSVNVSTTGSVTLSNIPNTFQDLMLVVSARTDSSSLTSALLRLNGDTSSVYSSTLLLGNGASALSERYSNESFNRIGYAIGSSQLTSTFSSQVIHILDYANTSRFKTIVSRDASDTNGSGIAQLAVALWRNTAAITSITYATSIVPGSTVTLYGIKAGA